MATIVIEVMPKAELLDPQGKAIAQALSRSGPSSADVGRIASVRVGKRFEITVEGTVNTALQEHVERLAREILSNDVIEDVVAIRVSDDTNSDPVHEPATSASS